MNILLYTFKERLAYVSSIKEDLADGLIKKEELTDEYLKNLNEEIKRNIFRNIQKYVKFNLYNSDGSFYKSMLGNGKDIDYSDLFEIYKRLYECHHESQTFQLELIDNIIKIEINYHVYQEHNLTSLLMKYIGKDWQLTISDFE